MSAPNSQTVTVLWDAYTYLKELQDNSVVVGHNYWGLDQLLERGHAAALQAQQDGPDRDAVLEEAAKHVENAPVSAIEHIKHNDRIAASIRALKNNAAPQAPANLASRPNAVASEDVTAAALPAGAAPSEAGADDARDAARYRFIRDHSDPDMEQPYITRHKVNSWGKWFNTCDKGDYADRVIDAELAKSNATDRREG